MGQIAHWYETRVFPHLLEVADRAVRDDRRQMLARASGDVLELGIGTGNSLPWYTPSVKSLVGIEPQGELLGQARRKLHQAPDWLKPRVRLVEAGGEQLPLPDNSIDMAIAFLVFCTIPDPAAAAWELRRVLRPGGRLLVFEHIQATAAGLQRWQKWLNPGWQKLACGCHLDRDTRSLLARAGFNTSGLQTIRHPSIPLPLVATILQGTAR